MYDENAYCKKCGRPIQFFRMKSGKLMPVDGFPFDIVPSDQGGIYFKVDGSSVRGVAVSSPGPNSVKAWQSHFVTCPEGEHMRQRADRKRERTQQAHERLEKEIAEAEAKAARKAEKERREAAQHAFEDQQLSIFAM